MISARRHDIACIFNAISLIGFLAMMKIDDNKSITAFMAISWLAEITTRTHTQARLKASQGGTAISANNGAASSGRFT